MPKHALPILTSMAILVLAGAIGFAQDMAELEVDHALTFDFETPHTDWAQPYALGKTRVLFFTDGHGTNPRECVEVMQRFDIEAEAVFSARPAGPDTSHWHGGEVGERRMLSLLKEHRDCFVFMGMDMTNMSSEMQYYLLKQVSDEDGIMQPSCWNDEQAVRQQAASLAGHFIDARQHGVFVWSLGDEVDTQGACLSPHCAEAYRTYLREQYGTLAALNASWSTDFDAWEEVGLSDPNDNEEAAAKRAGNFPRWFDRQAFKSYSFVQVCGKYAAAFRAIDPKSRTGFEGAGRFDRGDDLDLIIRNSEFWSPYPGTADEVIRSIAPRDFPRANWMGYTKDADSLLQKYWRMVTRGTDAVWYWRWDCIGAFHGWLAPDLRPFPAVKEILEGSQFMRDGLGDVLFKSEMLDDGIAILYSYPSTFAHRLGDGATYGGYESAHVAAHTLIRDSGLQFRYITDRMLRLGEFDQNRYKVLFLPRAAAIGPQEAAVIREYVEQGGTVVADVRPGIYDGHCKPLEEGVLDDLFGIQRTGVEAAVVVKDDVYGELSMDPSEWWRMDMRVNALAAELGDAMWTARLNAVISSL